MIMCRTLQEVEEQSSNGIGNPLYQINVLCAEITSLQHRVNSLTLREADAERFIYLAAAALHPDGAVAAALVRVNADPKTLDEVRATIDRATEFFKA